MKEIIQQLMLGLSTLTPPYNHVDIQNLFALYPPLDANQAPPELTNHVEQLNNLDKLVKQRFSLFSHRRHIVELNEQKSVLQQALDDQQDLVHQTTGKLTILFQQLKSQLNVDVHQEPQISPLDKGTALIVKEYCSQLVKLSSEIDSRAAKLKLLQLIELINTLLNELGTLGVNCSINDRIDGFQSVISRVTPIVEQLEQLKIKVSVLQQRLAQELPTENIQAKIKELEQLINNDVVHLEKIELETSIHKLPISIKERLRKEFTDAPNKSDLLSTYQNKMQTVYSYFNLSDWSLWIQDQHQYQLSQTEYEDSFSFLELLQQELELNRNITHATEQMELLNLLLLNTERNCDSSTDLSELVTEIKDLVNNSVLLSSLIRFTSSISPSDIYLNLHYNFPRIEMRLKQLSLALVKLNDLASIDTELNELRTRYKLWPHNDSNLPDRHELEQEIEKSESQNPSKASLKQQIELGWEFIESTKKLDLIIKKQEETAARKKDIETQLNLISPEVLKENLMHVITEQLDELRTKINIGMEEIKHLPLPSKILNEPSLTSPELVELSLPFMEAHPHSPQESMPSPQKIIPLQTVDIELAELAELSLPSPILDQIPTPLDIVSLQTADEILLNTSKSQTVAIELPELTRPSPPILKQIPTPLDNVPLQTSDEILLNTSKAQTIAKELPELTRPSPPILEQIPTPLDIVPLQTSDEILLNAPKAQTVAIELPELTRPSPPILEQIPTPLDIVPLQTTDEILLNTSKAQPVAIELPELTHPSSLNIVPLKTEDEVIPTASKVEQPFYRERPESTTSQMILGSKQSTPNLIVAELPSNQPTSEFSPHDEIDNSPIKFLTESEKQKQWYHQSLILLKPHPRDIQKWYRSLFHAIITGTPNEIALYKASHLLNDILFELRYKTDLDVIKAYMRLCPNPKKELNILLSLKPGLPLMEDIFDSMITDQEDTSEELLSLYVQYLKLKNDYPVESALLMQIIHSLRSVKTLSDTPNAHISLKHIPALSEDPRYEPLHRHRGVFRVWEAIEDFFRLIIGKIIGQEEYEYNKRPCFFKTKTAQLVEEANLAIQEDLPSP